MERTEIYETVTDIFRNVFDDEDIELKDETNAEDIEDWDSLAQITLISEMEKKFGIRFNMQDVIALQNVGDMIDLIERLL